MNPAKQAEKVTNRCPDPFNRIGMHLVKPITVCVSRPLAHFMQNNLAGALDMSIPTPPICIPLATGSVNG